MPLGIEHRLDIIIRTARSRTGNKDFSLTSGVPQRDFVQFANDAQNRIYNKILGTHSSLYENQVFLPTTAGVAAVPLPADIHTQHNITTVHFAYNGVLINMAPLELRSVRQQISVNGYPSSYFLLEDNIILSPIPSNSVANALRVTYQRIMPDLDIRRAKIAAVTGVLPAVTSVTLTADTTLIPETEDDLTNGWVDQVSFCDQNGTILASGKPAVSYNATTKVLTMNTTLGSTETLPTGSYLVFGKNATTHSQLPPIAERFLTEYVVLRAQMRDSNKEATDTSPLLQAIEAEILEAVEVLEEDISAIPVIDSSMLNYSDEL